MEVSSVLNYLTDMSFLTYVFLGIIAVILGYHQYFLTTRYSKLGQAIPGPAPLPLFGNCLMALFKDPKTFFNFVHGLSFEMFEYTQVAKIWLGTKLIVGIADPRDVEVVLNNHLEKSADYQFFAPWLGQGLLISKGEKWRTHRKLIAPTFHKTVLKSFIPIFNDKSMQIVQRVKKFVGKEFDVHDYMSTLTVDILLDTAMGLKRTTESEEQKGFKYAKAVMDMCNIIHLRHYKFWLRPNFIFNLSSYAKKQEEYLNIIHSLTNEVLRTKKRIFEKNKMTENFTNTYDKILKEQEKWMQQAATKNGDPNSNLVKDDLDFNDENDIGEKKRMAFLDFMIEASHTPGTNLTDEEIKEEVDTIMFEGHDTTAAASSFCLCALGVYQDIQERVVEELKEIFQGHKTRPVTYEDTLNMKYLERVIMETLRLYPPVPVITRKLNDDTEVRLPSGYTIPPGTTVVIGIYMMHHNHRTFEKPHEFNPDNFLPEKCAERNYYSYIPFSAGPRGCVGRKYAMLKLKVILANMLRNYKVTSPVDAKDFEFQGDIILKRADGFRIIFDERKF